MFGVPYFEQLIHHRHMAAQDQYGSCGRQFCARPEFHTVTVSGERVRGLGFRVLRKCPPQIRKREIAVRCATTSSGTLRRSLNPK